MLQPATGRDGSCRINRRTPFDNLRNLPIHIDDECRTVGQIRGAQNVVLFHDLSLVIGKHRKFRVQFLGPVIEGRYEISADRQNLRFCILKFANTRLVGG
jgi:hypothetical protein